MKINITDKLTFSVGVDLRNTSMSDILYKASNSPLELVIESSYLQEKSLLTLPTWRRKHIDRDIKHSPLIVYEEGTLFFEGGLLSPYFLPIYTSLNGEYLDELKRIPYSYSEKIYTIWRLQRNDVWGHKALDMYSSYLNGNPHPMVNKWGRFFQDYILNKLDRISGLVSTRNITEDDAIDQKILGTGYNFQLFVGIKAPNNIRVMEILKGYQSLLDKYSYHNTLVLDKHPIKRDITLKDLNKGVHEFKLPMSIISHNEVISLLGGLKENVKCIGRQEVGTLSNVDENITNILQLLPYSETGSDIIEDTSEDSKELVFNVADSLKRVGLINSARIYNSSVKVGVRLTIVQFSIPKNKTITQLQSKQRDIQASLGVDSLGIQQGDLPDTVKISIPNKEQTVISLRELLEDDSFIKFKSNNPLSFIAGVDEINTPIYLSLSKLVHLLVAGTTGSGKSVFLNSTIVSLLTTYTPKELQFVMIDPKEVELQHYEDFPHTRDVITDMEKASQTLQYLTTEMDNRYSLFKEAKVKNIELYNEKRGDTLPYIVCVVDEYADLKDLYPEVEDYIGRLGQKARASGIHLIISTQRPSTDIISGRVKAVIPNAISFNLNNHNNYRTVFGTGIPYSSLLGRGDGVMKIEGSLQEFQRFQSPIVVPNELEESEVYNRLSNYLNNIYSTDTEHKNTNYVSSSPQKSSSITEFDIEEESDLDKLKRIIATTRETRVAPLRDKLGVKTSIMPELMGRLVEEGWLIKHSSKAKGYELIADESILNKWESKEEG